MILGDVARRRRDMASSQDVDEVRRNRRRVRVRKATSAEKTTINSDVVVDGAAVPNDEVHSSTAPGVSDVDAAGQDSSTHRRTTTGAVRDRRRRTPATTIDGRVPDDSELTSAHELAASEAHRAIGDVGVHASTAADDDMDVDDGTRPPLDDSPAHLPHDAPKKSRAKRRVKNKGRRTAHATNEPPTDQLTNGLEGAGDWFTAVRNADIATVRRLAASKAVDVNSTDEVSRNRNSEQYRQKCQFSVQNHKVTMPLAL